MKNITDQDVINKLEDDTLLIAYFIGRTKGYSQEVALKYATGQKCNSLVMQNGEWVECSDAFQKTIDSLP